MAAGTGNAVLQIMLNPLNDHDMVVHNHEYIVHVVAARIRSYIVHSQQGAIYEPP